VSLIRAICAPDTSCFALRTSSLAVRERMILSRGLPLSE
jgi:hypothetical protein